MYYIHYVNASKNYLSFLLSESGLGLCCAYSDQEFANNLLKDIGIEAEIINFEISPIRCYYYSDYIEEDDMWEEKWRVIWKCQLKLDTHRFNESVFNSYIFTQPQGKLIVKEPENSIVKTEIVILVNFDIRSKLIKCQKEIEKSMGDGLSLVKKIKATHFIKLSTQKIAYNLDISLGEMNESEFLKNENEINAIISMCEKYGAIHQYDFEECF